jgi:hypothetical protein
MEIACWVASVSWRLPVELPVFHGQGLYAINRNNPAKTGVNTAGLGGLDTS